MISLHWTNTALAAGLLITAVPVSDPVHSSSAQNSACPNLRLTPYTSRPYATEEGVRRRCALLKDIERGGELQSSPLRDQVLNELAHRFAVEIDFTGVVGLPRRTVDYLLDKMPETAVLVSAYSDRDYKATQVDPAQGPKSFFVTNHDTFAAGFTYLSSRLSADLSQHMFFERGHAKVLFWRIWGNSFVRYKLRNEGEETAYYDIRVHVFTDSRLLRAVLKSGLFRYFAHLMFKGILDDIESAVHEFAADSNRSKILPPYFVTGLKRRLNR